MHRFLSVVLALVLCLMPVLSSAELAGTVSSDYEPLYQFAEPYGFRLGGAFGYWDMRNTAFMGFLDDHFNSLTCTNETKAYSLLKQNLCRTSPDGMPRMDYSQADQMLKWCQAHGKSVRGHVLVCQVITHFAESFPGVIYCWDVVNEAIGDSASDWRASDPRHIRIVRDGGPNYFQAYVGDDYVEYAFLCARNTVEKLGADIKLFYNDYNMFMTEKRNAAVALIKSIQSYDPDISADTAPSPAACRNPTFPISVPPSAPTAAWDWKSSSLRWPSGISISPKQQSTPNTMAVCSPMSS